MEEYPNTLILLHSEQLAILSAIGLNYEVPKYGFRIHISPDIIALCSFQTDVFLFFFNHHIHFLKYILKNIMNFFSSFYFK